MKNALYGFTTVLSKTWFSLLIILILGLCVLFQYAARLTNETPPSVYLGRLLGVQEPGIWAGRLFDLEVALSVKGVVLLLVTISCGQHWYKFRKSILTLIILSIFLWYYNLLSAGAYY